MTTTAERHFMDGSGIRCGYYEKDVTVRVGLSWDTITCHDCLSKKRPEEPLTTDIDCKGD